MSDFDQFIKQQIITSYDDLKTRRLKLVLALREVARRMRISAPYLSDLESGRRRWSEKLAVLYVDRLHEEKW